MLFVLLACSCRTPMSILQSMEFTGLDGARAEQPSVHRRNYADSEDMIPFYHHLTAGVRRESQCSTTLRPEGRHSTVASCRRYIHQMLQHHRSMSYDNFSYFWASHPAGGRLTRFCESGELALSSLVGRHQCQAADVNRQKKRTIQIQYNATVALEKFYCCDVLPLERMPTGSVNAEAVETISCSQAHLYDQCVQ